MLGLLKKMFGVKPAEVAPAVESAPYKVPEPSPVTPTPLVVETIPAAEVTAKNKAVAVAKAKQAPAKKVPAKKAPIKKTAAPKAPRKPKAP
jgi:hypothetical protein